MWLMTMMISNEQVTTRVTWSLEGQWQSGLDLEHRTGDRVLLGSNNAGGTLLRNFGNSVYTTLSLGGDSKSGLSLLSICQWLTVSEEELGPSPENVIFVVLFTHFSPHLI